MIRRSDPQGLLTVESAPADARDLRVVGRAHRGRGLRLSGELDRSNLDVLAAALRTEVTQGANIIVDCSELRFVDVGGCRLFAQTAERLGAAGNRLVLRACPAGMRKAMTLLEFDRVPGLFFA